MRNLAQSALEMSEKMSIEQMRLYQAYITKTVEAKEAEEAFLAAADQEGASDSRTSESLREVRAVLSDLSFRLSGSECVLLASFNKQLEGEETLDTKRLNIFLDSFERKPSNTTKIVDILSKKNLLKIESDGLHSHKTFNLTRKGEDQVGDLLIQLKNAAGRDRLAIVE